MKELLAIFLVVTATACIYRVGRHSPIMAATSATEFAQAALVERNTDKAFILLHPDFQAYTTKQKFAQFLTAMSSPGPLSINATHFEPLPGEEGMNIYLTGENDTQTFYYRIPMRGNQDKGYKPVGLFRNQGPYPNSSTRHPL